MRLTKLSLGALTLLLLIAVPVNAAPDLHTDSQASYNLSVSISILQSCAPILGSTLSAGIVCPMIATISPSLIINWTLGWTVTDLNATTGHPQRHPGHNNIQWRNHYSSHASYRELQRIHQRSNSHSHNPALHRARNRRGLSDGPDKHERAANGH